MIQSKFFWLFGGFIGQKNKLNYENYKSLTNEPENWYHLMWRQPDLSMRVGIIIDLVDFDLDDPAIPYPMIRLDNR